MKNRIFKSFAALLFSVIIMAPSAVFAAGTAGGTAADSVQAQSSATATLYVGKFLDVTQEKKFPTIDDFTFKVDAVKGWDNANSSAGTSGAAITAANMPQPALSTTSHHKVTPGGTSTAVTVGDFTGEANTGIADTSTEKYRVTPVNITFTKAGYYVYRISENKAATASIPGMVYDTSSYYAVIYVCNKTDQSGNTIPGVYVHDITSYRNSEETDYIANLSDLVNITDNGGKAAAADSSSSYGKVGISEEVTGEDPDSNLPTGPNKLEAFRFWNDQTTHDVVLTNNVTGNLGDTTKEFEYTVTLTGLEKSKTYTTGVAAQDKAAVQTADLPAGNQTSSGADIVSLASGGAGTVDTAGKTFTSDANGNASFKVMLADDETIVLNALPATSKYTVNELATDHVASFTSESTSKDWVMAAVSKANTVNNTALSTNEETVDAVSTSDDNDGTVTINFKNHKDMVTVTGLPFYGTWIYWLAALVIAGIAVFFIRRRTDIKRS